MHEKQSQRLELQMTTASPAITNDLGLSHGELFEVFPFAFADKQ